MGLGAEETVGRHRAASHQAVHQASTSVHQWAAKEVHSGTNRVRHVGGSEGGIKHPLCTIYRRRAEGTLCT